MTNYQKFETVLKVENLSITLDDKLILRDLNLHIEDIQIPGEIRGQIESIVGPSGVGKTTLINALSGWYTPKQNSDDGKTFKMQGQCLIGNPLTTVKLGQVGLVQQTYPLFEDLTVLKNLSFINSKYTKVEGLQKAKDYLNFFEMWDKKDCYPYQLSGGQRQRVAILQALLSSNHYILMDEPFSGLDINMIEKTIDTLRKIADLDELNTIIIITHDISSACAISDNVHVMGREKDQTGKDIPGAKILYEYDLAQRGLAWQPDIRNLSSFAEITKEIRSNFKNLG